ncbi:MAG: hypothetical protein ACYTFY_02085 [Planctomycetota bacterium]
MKLSEAVFLLPTLIASLFLLGCGSEISAYKYADYQPEKRTKILVLPFLDTRTFKDKADPLKDKVAERARLLFIKELRAHKKLNRAIVIAPELEKRSHDYSLYDVKCFAEKYNSELVFCGQVFSFTGTRAASIPPRSGLFVRAFDGANGKLVFAGESYNAAGVPGADGGREHQCSVAAAAVVRNFIEESSAATAVIKSVTPDLPKVLILPFRERKNPINLIENNGGGPVVTSIYGMELARSGRLNVLHGVNSDKAGFQEPLSSETALKLAADAGADYVIRGEVVEFRRAQSVPSLWSAAISLSILAAQVMFAEVSGVDIAAEIYRVSDGACIYAKRDISHQKYVVSAEKTVRVIAVTNASQMVYAIENNAGQNPVKPLIDSIEVPKTKEEIEAAAKKLAGTENKEILPPESAGSLKKEDAAVVDASSGEKNKIESTEKKAVAVKQVATPDKAVAADAGAEKNKLPPLRRK